MYIDINIYNLTNIIIPSNSTGMEHHYCGDL